MRERYIIAKAYLVFVPNKFVRFALGWRDVQYVVNMVQRKMTVSKMGGNRKKKIGN